MSGLIPVSLGTPSFPEIGKIKLGEKTQKSMRAIDHFRFLSNDRPSLEILAETYGGKIVSFNDSKSQYKYELKSMSAEIDVILPPSPLGEGPMCELYGGKGRERRCDLTDCQIEVAGPDGPEPAIVPCLCASERKFKCDVRTRLKVVLPACRFAGTWTIETKSEIASGELVAMVRTIESAGQLGMTRARMVISDRVSRGGTRKYKVPTLVLDHTFEELVAGAAAVTGSQVAGQLGQGDQLAIGRGDDDVYDAEVIDEQVSLDRGSQLKAAGALLTDEQRGQAKAWRESQMIPPHPDQMSADEFTSLLAHLKSYTN